MNDFYRNLDEVDLPGASDRRYTTRLTFIGHPERVDEIVYLTEHVAQFDGDAALQALFGADNLRRVVFLELGVFVIDVHSHRNLTAEVDAFAFKCVLLHVNAVISDREGDDIAWFQRYGDGKPLIEWQDVREYARGREAFELNLLVEADEDVIDAIDGTTRERLDDPAWSLDGVPMFLIERSRIGRFLAASYSWDEGGVDPRDVVALLVTQFPDAAIRFELVVVGKPRIQVAVYESGVMTTAWASIPRRTRPMRVMRG